MRNFVRHLLKEKAKRGERKAKILKIQLQHHMGYSYDDYLLSAAQYLAQEWGIRCTLKSKSIVFILLEENEL